MRRRGDPIDLPENPAPYITDWLMEIGPLVSGGMGEAPVGWQDMAAWSEMIGVELDPWEARSIRRLSRVFMSQRHDARKPDCPPPFSPTRDQVESRREIVARKVEAAFGGLVGKKG